MAKLDPLAMSIDNAAELLSTSIKQAITADQIKEDIADGAPTNGDGTINLVNYAAWLARQAARPTDRT